MSPALALRLVTHDRYTFLCMDIVMSHRMFGVLGLTADQLLRLLT